MCETYSEETSECYTEQLLLFFVCVATSALLTFIPLGVRHMEPVKSASETHPVGGSCFGGGAPITL